MQNTGFKIQSWDDLPRGIVAAEQAGATGLAHLLRALAARRIAFLPLLPDHPACHLKRFIGATKHRPTIVLIGDDDYQDRGPAGWKLAERAVRWAEHILIHAAGAELHHYESAILQAAAGRRVLIIECSTATARAWVELIPRPKIKDALLIWPFGGPHPIMPPKDRMQ